jgi:hypothetical protein
MNIADILIHVHPELSAQQREKMEAGIGARDGMVSVHFSSGHLHELIVAYDPEAVSSQQILELVRRWDQAATMVGL